MYRFLIIIVFCFSWVGCERIEEIPGSVQSIRPDRIERPVWHRDVVLLPLHTYLAVSKERVTILLKYTGFTQQHDGVYYSALIVEHALPNQSPQVVEGTIRWNSDNQELGVPIRLFDNIGFRTLGGTGVVLEPHYSYGILNMTPDEDTLNEQLLQHITWR
jgi:hypothetical protein